MGVHLNPDQNNRIFHRIIARAGLEPVQKKLVNIVEQARGMCQYEFTRAKQIFIHSPHTRRLQKLFDKYFPEGLFPESEALASLKARLDELSFASGQARNEFLGNDAALHEMSFLHDDRDPTPISPEVFRAILEKRTKDQEGSFEEMLNYITSLADREDGARIDECAILFEETALAKEEEAAALLAEAVDLEEEGQQEQAAAKRIEADQKTEEAEEIRERMVGLRQEETRLREGVEANEEEGIEGVVGEAKYRRETAERIKDARAIRSMIAEGASKTEVGEMEEFVKETADFLSTQLTATPDGQRLLYMGMAGTETVGVKGILNIPGFEKDMPSGLKAILSEEDPQVIGQMARRALADNIGPMIREFMGEDAIQRLQLQHQQAHPQGGAGELDPIALFEKYTIEMFKNIEGVLNRQIPEEWTAEIVHSLKEDAREAICGVRQEGAVELSGIEELYEKVAGQGFEAVVERAVGETLVSIRSVLTERVDDFFALTTQFLPSAALAALTSQGIVPNIENPYWIDFEKNEDGTYSVRLFANGLAAEALDEVTLQDEPVVQDPVDEIGGSEAQLMMPGGLGSGYTDSDSRPENMRPENKGPSGKTGLRVPLVFENVPAEKLNEEFFRLLVDYEYRPQYVKALHSYTVEHVIHGVTTYLGEPKVATDISEIMPHRVVEERGPLSLASLYLFSNQNRDICQFYSEHTFDVALHALVDYWKIHGNQTELRKDRALRSQMRSAINYISQEAIIQNAEGSITNQKLQRIYATVWEIEKALYLANQHSVKDRQGGIVLPPQVQDGLKALLMASGADTTYLEAVKEVFLAAAGDDCEEIFDEALSELMPEFVNAKSISEAEVLDWKDIFKIETVRKKIEYLKMNRISALQLVKFYAKMMVLLFSVYRVSLSAKTIAKTLDRYYPDLKKKLPFSTFHVGMILTLFGPHVFAKILPKDVYESIAAIYHLASQVSWYVMSRMLTQGTKQIIKQVMNHYEVDTQGVRDLAKKFQQEVLRKGEVGYEVTPSEGNHDEVRIVLDQGPVNAALQQHATTPLFEDDIPKPNAVTLTTENYEEILDGWVANARTLKDRFGEDQNYDLIYLNEQIRNLPVGSDDTDNIWNQYPEAARKSVEKAIALETELDNGVLSREARLEKKTQAKASRKKADAIRDALLPIQLEKIHNLLVALYDASQNTQQTPQHRTETVISFYTLYAIADCLAKNSENSGLDDFSHAANGADLFRFTQKAGLKVTHEKSLQQLRVVCQYFNFELGDRLDEAGIQSKFSLCHFNYEGLGSSLQGRAFTGTGREITVTPWQSFFGTENDYFSGLLQRPEIVARLEAHGVGHTATRAEKQLTLFRDPPASEAPQGAQEALDRDRHDLDPRHGVLPREYYILRLAHLMSSSRAVFGREFEGETFLEDPHDSGLVIAKIEIPELPPQGLFERIIDFGSNLYHTATRGAFRAQRLSGNLGSLTEQEERVKALGEQTIGRDIQGIGTEHTVGASQRTQEKYAEENFGEKRKSQIDIIETTQLVKDLGLLTVEESHILEMVQSYDKDRLIRAIGIFSYRKDRLRHPEFRVLFDLLCQNLVGLEAQARERVEVGKTIGKFFVDTIDHFKGTGDLETALFMMKMGIELEGFFASHDPTLRESFPDFAQEIRESIIPTYQAKPEKLQEVNFGERSKISGIYLALTTLATSYMNTDISSLGGGDRDRALFDLARFAFYQGRQLPEFQNQSLCREAKRVVFKYAAELRGSLDDEEFRKGLLDQIFVDSGVNLREKQWNGDFPVYRNEEIEGLTVNLIERTIYGHSSVYLKEKGEEELRNVFGKEDLGACENFGLNVFNYPDLGVSIEWIEDERRFQILKYIDGEPAKYCSKEEITVEWGFSPFDFQEKDLIFFNDSMIHVYRAGERIARFTFERGSEVTKREHFIDGEWHEAVDLSQQQHQLTLLNWFVNLDDVEAYSQHQPAVDGAPAKDRLTYLKLKPLDLEFKIVEKDGKLQAVSLSEGTKGYVLCERQSDPRLYHYPHAIILKNATGAEKVILKSLPLVTLLAKFGINNAAGQKTSPFVDEVMINQLVVKNYEKHVLDGLEEELAKENDPEARLVQTLIIDNYRRHGWDKPQYFTSHFDGSGELTAKDPNMLTYLALYHFSRGDIDAAVHYFEKLETFGRKYPFTEASLNYIDRLIVLLGYSPEPLAIELTLRLAAIREKNYLVHMPTENETEEAQNKGEEIKYDRFEILRSLVIQEKYVNYLENMKFGGRQYLTPEDELFIFKTLMRGTKEMFTGKSKGLAEESQGYVAEWGTDYIAQILLRPTLVHRYMHLCMKYKESGRATAAINTIISEAYWYDRSNPYTTFLAEPKRRGPLGQINALGKKVFESPLKKSYDINYAEEMSAPSFNLEEVPVELHEINPELLLTEFLHYYRLAVNEIPARWSDDPDMTELFARKRATFLEALPLLKGNYASKYYLFYVLLVRASEGGSENSSSLQKTSKRIAQASEITGELLHTGASAIREAGTFVKDTGKRLKQKGGVVGYGSRLFDVSGTALEYGSGLARVPGIGAKKVGSAAEDFSRSGLVGEFPASDLMEGLAFGGDAADQNDFNDVIKDLLLKARFLEGLEDVGDVATLENAWGVIKRGVRVASKFTTRPARFVVGQVFLPLTAGFSERCAQAFHSTAPVPRFVVKGFSRVWKEQYALMMEQEGPVKEREKVSEELAGVLIQRESSITNALADFLDEYCDVTRTPTPSVEPIPSFEIEGIEDDALVRGFEEFNEALEGYYARNPGETVTFSLKEGRTAEEFIHSLKRLKEEVLSTLEEEQEAILSFVNQENLDENDAVERSISRLEKVKVGNNPLRFYDVLKWYMTEDDAIMLDRSETSEEHLPILKEKVSLYLLTLSRFNLLFKKLETAKPSEGIESLANELVHERTYQFEADVPERLLKALLAYEALTGKMLWEVQSSHLRRMNAETASSLLNVMIMGDGKSSTVMPIESYVDAESQKSVIFNVCPKTVKGQTLDMMEKNAGDVYGQGINSFVFDRRRNWDSERLWALLKVLSGGGKMKEQFNVTQEDLQSLLLRFLDEGLDVQEKFRVDKASKVEGNLNQKIGLVKRSYNSAKKKLANGLQKYLPGESDYERRIRYYKEILNLIREKGIGSIDEIHEAAREDKELNFPVGNKKTLKMQYAEILEEVILQLVSTPEVAEYIWIKDREPKTLEPDVFEEHVAPIIATKLAALRRLEIPGENQDAIAAYLCGQSEEIPECAKDHPKFKEIALMRGALIALVPKTLERIVHKHFHKASTDTGVEYVKPSEGNVNTVDEADFLSPFETFVKSCCLYLRDRLSDAQVKKMINHLKTKGEDEAKEKGIHFDLTPTAKLFKASLCPGVDLSSLGEEVDPEIIEQLRGSDALTLAYVRVHIRAEIKYYPTVLESNGQDLIGLFSSIRSHTGTPEKELLPGGTSAIEREGILGQSLYTFESRTTSIRVFEDGDPERVLEDSVIRDFFNQSMNHMMFTDRGAAVNGLTTEEVATKIWDGIQGVRTDIKGVVFFRKDTAMILTEAGVVPLNESRIKPEERLTYFDEPHTYAADVPQKRGAVALLTIGETTTFEKEIDQAQYRARGIETFGQSQIVGMTRHVRDKVIGEDRAPTKREVTIFTRLNGRTAKKKRRFAIDSQKLESLVKKAIREKALSAETSGETCQILRSFEHILVSTVSDDPVDLFGYLKVSQDRKGLLKAIQDRLLNELKTTYIPGIMKLRTPYFSPEEIEKIGARLTRVIEGDRYELAYELFETAKTKILEKTEEHDRRTEVLNRFNVFLNADIALELRAFFNTPEGSGENSLEVFKNHIVQVIRNEFFTEEELEEITEILNGIVAMDIPPVAEEQVQAFQKDGELSTETLGSLGRSVQVRAQAEAEEEEQEQELSNINNLAQSGQEDDFRVRPQDDMNWSDSLVPTDPDTWFTLRDPREGFPALSGIRGYTPPLFTLSDGLKLAENEAAREFAETLPSYMCCSWNMFKVFTSSFLSRRVEPFGPRQKPIFEYLLVKEGPRYRMIIIDQKEADFWRGKLKEDRDGDHPKNEKLKIALVDNITNAVVATGSNAMDEEDLDDRRVRRARTILKVMSGYTNFSEEELITAETWMKQKGVDSVVNFYESTAYRGHEKEPYDGSTFQALVYKLKDRVPEPEVIRV